MNIKSNTKSKKQSLNFVICEFQKLGNYITKDSPFCYALFVSEFRLFIRKSS